MQKGEPVTKDVLNELWHELNVQYYGPDMRVEDVYKRQQYNDTVGSDGTEGAKKKNKDKQDALKKSQSESETGSEKKSSSDD